MYTLILLCNDNIIPWEIDTIMHIISLTKNVNTI